MCGGLVVSVARTRREIFIYHLGRLLSYTTLGGLAGGLGEKVLTPGTESIFSWIAAITIGISLILMGLRTWGSGNLHLIQLPSKVLHFLFRQAEKNTFLTGSLSAFLPCGWLQNFVLAAVATRTASSGALLLFFFWLGTLPVMTFTPLLIERLFRPIAKKLPRLSALLLISSGLLSIGLKAAQSSHCHLPQQDKIQSVGQSRPQDHSHHHLHLGQIRQH